VPNRGTRRRRRAPAKNVPSPCAIVRSRRAGSMVGRTSDFGELDSTELAEVSRVATSLRVRASGSKTVEPRAPSGREQSGESFTESPVSPGRSPRNVSHAHRLALVALPCRVESRSFPGDFRRGTAPPCLDALECFVPRDRYTWMERALGGPVVVCQNGSLTGFDKV